MAVLVGAKPGETAPSAISDLGDRSAVSGGHAYAGQTVVIVVDSSVVCGAGPAAATGTLVKLAHDRGWTV